MLWFISGPILEVERRPIPPRAPVAGSRLFHDASENELAGIAGGDRLAERPPYMRDVRRLGRAAGSVGIGDAERGQRAPALAAVDRDARAFALAAGEGDGGGDRVGDPEARGRRGAAVAIAEQENQFVAGRDDAWLLA